MWLDHQALLGGQLHAEFLRGLYCTRPCFNIFIHDLKMECMLTKFSRDTKLGHMPYKKPRKHDLFSPEKSKTWGNLTVALKALREVYQQDGDRLFTDVQWENKRQWL